MDILLPAGGADLHEFYGRNWLEPGGVRVNFIASVDGRATAGGLSRGLQTDGDNRVFAALRDLADVIMVGASTAATEGYRAVDLSPSRQDRRRALGLSPMPATAVVSGSLHLDLSADLYQNARPEAPTILVTGPHAPVSTRNDIIDLAGADAAVQLVEVPAAGSGVSFAGAVRRLNELGYRRILCEGGPRLFAAGVADGSVSELCLTISPRLVGAAGPGILAGDGWPDGFAADLALVGLLAEQDALFCRYALRPSR